VADCFQNRTFMPAMRRFKECSFFFFWIFFGGGGGIFCFKKCSHCVPIKFPMCSLRCSQYQFIFLSHIVWPWLYISCKGKGQRESQQIMHLFWGGKHILTSMSGNVSILNHYSGISVVTLSVNFGCNQTWKAARVLFRARVWFISQYPHSMHTRWRFLAWVLVHLGHTYTNFNKKIIHS
jgi:hypothetical protein